ncbi:MAG: hypothetical protein IJ545_08125 [Alphaproteobacteria bacterium]|nr:hypothetical protein [Alphaproteobacteria bacterium]
MEEKVLTPFDYGFELAKSPKLEKNLYNVDGYRCPDCPIYASCLLLRKKHPSLCFEGLHKALMQTNVCQKVLNKENVSSEEVALHLYVDSMLYQLDKLTDVQKVPLELFDLWDLRTDCALDEEKGGNLGARYAVICRFLGRQVVDILRERGYEI